MLRNNTFSHGASLVLAALSLVACAANKPSLPDPNVELEAQLQAREFALQEQQVLLAQRTEALDVLAAKLESEATTNKRKAQRLKDAERALAKRKKQVAVAAPKSTGFLVVGSSERITMRPPGTKLLASMDTGASRSTLGVYDLTEFERDGEPYARFSLIAAAGADKVEVTRPIKKRTKDTALNASGKKRPVVAMRVQLGSIDESIEFLLVEANKAAFSDVSIGRNLLRDLAIVDVSRKMLVKTPSGK